jgi:hypothetical protein
MDDKTTVNLDEFQKIHDLIAGAKGETGLEKIQSIVSEGNEAKNELAAIGEMLKWVKGSTTREKVKSVYDELGSVRREKADWEDRRRNLERIERYVLDIATDLNSAGVPNNDETLSRAKLELPDRVRWTLKHMKEVERSAEEKIAKAESRPPKDVDANAGMAYTHILEAKKSMDINGDFTNVRGLLDKAILALCQTRYSEYFDKLAAAKIETANLAEKVTTLVAKLREAEEERDEYMNKVEELTEDDDDEADDGEAAAEPTEAIEDPRFLDINEYRAAVRVLSRELTIALTVPGDDDDDDGGL